MGEPEVRPGVIVAGVEGERALPVEHRVAEPAGAVFGVSEVVVERRPIDPLVGLFQQAAIQNSSGLVVPLVIAPGGGRRVLPRTLLSEGDPRLEASQTNRHQEPARHEQALHPASPPRPS